MIRSTILKYFSGEPILVCNYQGNSRGRPGYRPQVEINVYMGSEPPNHTYYWLKHPSTSSTLNFLIDILSYIGNVIPEQLNYSCPRPFRQYFLCQNRILTGCKSTIPAITGSKEELPSKTILMHRV